MSKQPLDPLIHEQPPPPAPPRRDSSAPQPAAEALNPISCELCRSRKTKCSRILPSCRECVKHGQECTWPERAKRGPPTGYIESLESRLAHTEAALFNALAALGVGTSTEYCLPTDVFDRFAKFSSAQVRADRMATWTAAPLDNPDAQLEWWRRCYEKIVLPDELPTHPRQKPSQNGDSPAARVSRPRKAPESEQAAQHYTPYTDDSVMHAVAQAGSYEGIPDKPNTPPMAPRPVSYNESIASQNSGAAGASSEHSLCAGTKRRIEDLLGEHEPSQDRKYF